MKYYIITTIGELKNLTYKQYKLLLEEFKSIISSHGRSE